MTKLEILKRGIERNRNVNRVSLKDYFYKEGEKTYTAAEKARSEALNRNSAYYEDKALEIKLNASMARHHEDKMKEFKDELVRQYPTEEIDFNPPKPWWKFY